MSSQGSQDLDKPGRGGWVWRVETAREAAGGQDVRIGGGPTVVRDFLAAGLVDHMHTVVVPILLAEAYASGTDWRAAVGNEPTVGIHVYGGNIGTIRRPSYHRATG